MTTTDLRKVSILDLDMEQVETIEEACGVAVKDWSSPPSQGKLFRYILAAGNGIDPEDERLKKMKLGQFLDLVSVADDAVDPTTTDEPKGSSV